MIKLKDLLTERKVKVPNKGIFPNKEKAINFIKNLEQDDTPVYNIVDGETGEIFMEPGQTKRKQEKQWKKYEKNMYKLIYGDEEEFVYDSRYDVIDNFYTILRKDLDHGMSKKEKEKMRQADYDLSYNVPVKISRKDRKPFTSQDVDNMKEFEKYYNNKRLPQNLRFQIYAKKGKKVADTETLFA